MRNLSLLSITTLLLLTLMPLAVNSTDLSGSLSLRTPREQGNPIDWQVGTELRDGDNQIWLAWEREDGKPERERNIRLSCPGRWLVVSAQENVKTAQGIDEQKVSVLRKGNVFSIGGAYSWLSWEKPRPVLDVQANWHRGIVHVRSGFSTDFGKRQTLSGELRIEQPISKWFKVGLVGRGFKGVQGENWQVKGTVGVNP